MTMMACQLAASDPSTIPVALFLTAFAIAAAVYVREIRQ
jgi:hypothetical protein